MEAKAGFIAGQIWETLNASHGALTEKQIMKEIKNRKVSDFYLGIGWLLREGKLNVEKGETVTFSLR